WALPSKPGGIVCVWGRGFHARRESHRLDQRREVLVEIGLRVRLKGGMAKVALQNLARGCRDGLWHIHFAAELEAKVEIVAQQFGRECRGPVQIDQRRGFVTREHRSHHAVVEEGEERM